MTASRPAGSRGAAVRLDRLHKDFGGASAVSDLSLEVGAGEFMTLLGPSGSGQSTTLLMIAGFAVPTRGEVYVGGTAITRKPPHERDIGIVFQNYALLPHLTVFDNVVFPLQMRRQSAVRVAERVGWALELIRLGGLGSRYPHQLSGGQQQRVALARALVFEPSLLLMDEPLGALDRRLRETMQGELKRLQRALGLTVICVTHDQEEALTLSDRIAAACVPARVRAPHAARRDGGSDAGVHPGTRVLRDAGIGRRTGGSHAVHADLAAGLRVTRLGLRVCTRRHAAGGDAAGAGPGQPIPRSGPDLGGTGLSLERTWDSPGRPATLVLNGVAALVVVFLIVPVLVVVPISFSSSQYLEFPPRGFSLQ